MGGGGGGGGNYNMDDIKRSITINNHSNTGILRPEELSKMFPTPPSLEHHPNSSPCGGALSDLQDLYDSSPNFNNTIEEGIEVILIFHFTFT